MGLQMFFAAAGTKWRRRGKTFLGAGGKKKNTEKTKLSNPLLF
jgi:hypothetical protein